MKSVLIDIPWQLAAAALMLLAACTSTVVVEPQGDDGGNGGNAGNSGSGASGSSSSADSTSTGGTASSGPVTVSASSGGSTAVSTGTGPPPTPCEIACVDLYQCGLQDNLCPGFTVGGQSGFVAGCVPTCEEQPALISVVDPNDCPGTIQVLNGVSQDFQALCQGGP